MSISNSTTKNMKGLAHFTASTAHMYIVFYGLFGSYYDFFSRMSVYDDRDCGVTISLELKYSILERGCLRLKE